MLDLQFAEMQGNTVYDLSGNGNNGTIYGATWRKGPLLGSLYFDGVDDYVKTSAFIGPARTLEVLVMRIGDGSPLWNPVIVKGTAAAGYNYELRILQHHIGYFGIGVNTVVTEHYYVDIYPFPTNKWFYAVATYDDVELKLYINSENVFTKTIDEQIKTVDTGGAILGGDPVYANYFNGYIAFARVYNRVLSDSEIKAHYRYLMGYVNRIKRRFVG